MGNTNKRASPRPSQSGAQWDEASVLRLISENKLAPKYGDNATESGKSSQECPICFLEFGILNTVNCCKQHICTDCLVQVKGTDAKGACPFCGNADLNASLIPLPLEKKSASAPASSKTATPAKAKDDRTSSISEGDRSSGASAAALSYTTPEQEKKLRSYSLDETTPSNGTHSAMASKNDREALERQIREQRLQFDERDLAEATARSARSSNLRANSAGTSYLRYNNRTRYGAAGGRYADAAGEEGAAAERTSPTNGNLRFVSSLEGLLQNHGNTRITSIEQLEDIMLMEAIRLSMQDTGVSSDPSNSGDGPAQAVAAPPPRGASSSSSSRTSSPLPPIPPNSHHTSYHSSHHSSHHSSSWHSPARSAGTPLDHTSRATTALGNEHDSRDSQASAESAESGESGNSEDEHSDENEEEEEGEEGEGRGSSGYGGGLYGLHGHDEEDEEALAAEEEEQIRLAMELSLAEANHNTTNNTPSNTNPNTPHAGDGSSTVDTALDTAVVTDTNSERDSPHTTDIHTRTNPNTTSNTASNGTHTTSGGEEVVRKRSASDESEEAGCFS